MTQTEQNLDSAVTLLADYIAATADPKRTTVKAVALLIGQIKAIEDDARQRLGKKDQEKYEENE